MENLTEEQIQKALDEAYKEAGHNAYFGNGFKAGVAYALKEVFEKFQEIEHESEFYGWLYAKSHEA